MSDATFSHPAPFDARGLEGNAISMRHGRQGRKLGQSSLNDPPYLAPFPGPAPIASPYLCHSLRATAVLSPRGSLG